MCTPLWASLNEFKELGLVPILHEGRVKPLDTFSRVKLKAIYGKSKFENLSSTQWMAEVLFEPSIAYKRKIFNIFNRDVRTALGLSPDQKYFTFVELYTAFGNNQDIIKQVFSVEEAYLDLTNRQIKELYNNFADFMGMSRTFSFLFKDFKAGDLGMYSYFDLMRATGLENFPKAEAFKQIAEEDSTLANLTLIPTGTAEDIVWETPWSQTMQGKTEKVSHWNDLYKGYMLGDQKLFNQSAGHLQLPENDSRFKMETILNKVHFVQWSVALYVLSFLLISIYFLAKKEWIKESSSLALYAGVIIHTALICMRSYIMLRPPVTNLYESIIFVGWTAVIIGLIYEYRKQNEIGLFLGSVLGSMLLFLSYGYEKTGDNLSMIVAVLDTNFWLATHVVTISIGYGCALVASALAHLYLFKYKATNPEDSAPLKRNIHYTLLFALFFTVLGTILGGIWADQSWGRFWGWDPKENGALLICLWLLWIAHAKISRHFKDLGYAFFTALTSIIVVVAWFGVNLLNVGLHSYGFSNDAATNLTMFGVIELALTITLYAKAKWSGPSNKEKMQALSD